MSSAFESTITAIFTRCDQTVADRLAREKTKAENLQAQSTSRFGFTLAEAIEHEIRSAVEEALASYDDAINRPLTPNELWEDALRRRTSQAVDAALRKAMTLEREGPWKPLLTKEAPALRGRLLAVADQHFAELRKRHGQRGRPSEAAGELAVKFAIFAAGAVTGALLARVLAAVS